MLMNIPWAAQEPWVAILVMMLSIGFWIVSSLIKALAEPARQARPGQAPVDQAPISLEEFLQEARRRRGENNAGTVVSPVATAKEPSAPEPARVAANAAKRRKARLAREAAPVQQTSHADQPTGSGLALPAVPAVAALTAIPEALSILVQSTPTGERQVQHPFNRFLGQVLADKRNIQATILLGEVLGQPMCRKRRGLSGPHFPAQNSPE